MVSSVTAFDYFGANAPDADLVDAPVGAFYRQVGTSRVWVKYGTQKYNWTLLLAAPRDGFVYRDEAFVALWLSLSHVGGGNEVIGGEGDHPGTGTQSVISTVTPDRSRILHGNSAPVGNLQFGGASSYYVEYLVNTPIIQDATDRWSDRRGWIDTAVSVEPTNGAYFESDLAVNGNSNWWGVTANGGVRTKTDLGIAPAAGVWQRLRAEVSSAGAAARFLIENVLIATNVANIPTAAPALWTASQMVKTLGNVNTRTVKYDYVEVSATFSR